MDCVFAAEAAIFIHFELFGGILFVLHRVVISLLAFIASQNDFNAHFGTSIFVASLL